MMKKKLRGNVAPNPFRCTLYLNKIRLNQQGNLELFFVTIADSSYFDTVDELSLAIDGRHFQGAGIGKYW